MKSRFWPFSDKQSGDISTTLAKNATSGVGLSSASGDQARAVGVDIRGEGNFAIAVLVTGIVVMGLGLGYLYYNRKSQETTTSRNNERRSEASPEPRAPTFSPVFYNSPGAVNSIANGNNARSVALGHGSLFIGR